MRKIAVCGALFAIFLIIFPIVNQTSAAWFLSDPKSFGQTLDTAESSNRVQKEGYDMSTQVNMMNSLGCLVVGCSTNPASSLYYQKSAVASVGNYLASMYANPPADTFAFIQDMGQSLGFVPKQAYAQGVGFSGLAPLLGIWKAFRNISYALLTFVMIVIGFMIMFRRKIDPKTVVTVQNALPRIIITLILITFSYAIVGLLIDLMYLIILLSIAIIGGSGLQNIDIPGLQQLYTSGRTLGLMGRVFSSLNALTPAGGLVGGGIGGVIGQVAIPIPILGAVIGALIGGLAGGAATGGAAGALSPFLFIFFAIALFFGFIRLLFMLIMAYVQIILGVVLGPIQILLEAVPGTNGFVSWFTNIIANLAAFPITAILLLIGDVISQNIKTTFWVPPLIPGGTADIIRSIIGIGIVLSIPTIYGTIKKSLKIQPAPVGFGIGGVGGTTMQLLSLGVSIKQLGGGAVVDRILGKKPSGGGGSSHP